MHMAADRGHTSCLQILLEYNKGQRICPCRNSDSGGGGRSSDRNATRNGHNDGMTPLSPWNPPSAYLSCQRNPAARGSVDTPPRAPSGFWRALQSFGGRSRRSSGKAGARNGSACGRQRDSIANRSTTAARSSSWAEARHHQKAVGDDPQLQVTTDARQQPGGGRYEKDAERGADYPRDGCSDDEGGQREGGSDRGGQRGGALTCGVGFQGFNSQGGVGDDPASAADKVSSVRIHPLLMAAPIPLPCLSAPLPYLSNPAIYPPASAALSIIHFSPPYVPTGSALRMA